MSEYNLLLVDDEPLIRRGVAKIVHRHFNDMIITKEAQDGSEALEIIGGDEPDIVISDIKMDGMDGFGLAQQISENYPDILNIILTGYDDFSYAQEMIKHNVYAYVLKPIDTADFVELLKRAKSEVKKRKKLKSIYDFAAIHYDGVSAEINKIIFNGNLLYDIHAKNSEGIKKIFSEIFRYLRESTVSLEGAAIFSGELLYMLHNESCGQCPNEERVEQLKQMSSIDDQERFLLETVDQVTSDIGDGVSARGAKLVENVKGYVRSNINGDLSLKSLSWVFHFNISYFSNLFKQLSGESYINYVTKVRIEKAIENMKNAEYNISEIAEKAGYANANYFCRLFKKHTGMTPSEYRDQIRQR
jgi:two-component system response regulator YesN